MSSVSIGRTLPCPPPAHSLLSSPTVINIHACSFRIGFHSSVRDMFGRRRQAALCADEYSTRSSARACVPSLCSSCSLTVIHTERKGEEEEEEEEEEGLFKADAERERGIEREREIAREKERASERERRERARMRNIHTAYTLCGGNLMIVLSVTRAVYCSFSETNYVYLGTYSMARCDKFQGCTHLAVTYVCMHVCMYVRMYVSM